MLSLITIGWFDKNDTIHQAFKITTITIRVTMNTPMTAVMIPLSESLSLFLFAQQIPHDHCIGHVKPKDRKVDDRFDSETGRQSSENLHFYAQAEHLKSRKGPWKRPATRLGAIL